MRMGALLAAVVAALLLLAACGGDDEAAESPAGETEAAETEAATPETSSIQIGISPDPAYAPYIVADRQGFFENHGLQAEIRRFSNGGDMNDAVVAGEIDYSGSGTGTLLPRLATGRETIFAVTATSGTTFGIAATTELQDADDFRGKKLGMVPGTTSEYVWEFFLQEHGISNDEVEMVGAPPPELVSALDSGEIDAFIVWEPWPTQAVRTSGEDTVHIFGRNEDVGYLLYFSFAGNTEFMEQNPNTTVALLQAVSEAIDFINENPDEAVAIMADVMQLSEDEARPLVEDYQYELGLPDELRQDVADTAAWLEGLDRLDTEVAYEDVVNPTFIEQVEST
jgi:NitT/TauT family transport system substrate-binding protein